MRDARCEMRDGVRILEPIQFHKQRRLFAATI